MKKKYKILLRTLCSCEKRVEIPTLTPIIEVILDLPVVNKAFHRRCFVQSDEICKGRIVFKEYLTPNQLEVIINKDLKNE